MEQKEQKKQKAKITWELDGAKLEIESGTALLVVKGKKGIYTRQVLRDDGEAFFDLYLNIKEAIEDWEKKEPSLANLYKRTQELLGLAKDIGVKFDLEEGDDNE